MTATEISLDDQIAAVHREVKMRRRVYPNQVRLGKMTQAEADKELARMQAVLRTLEHLRQTERCPTLL